MISITKCISFKYPKSIDLDSILYFGKKKYKVRGIGFKCVKGYYELDLEEVQ